MRLIDADALKAEWYRLNDINEEDCGARFVGYQEIARLINNAPTVSGQGDYISRADAIEAVASITMSIHLSDVICDKLMALPSADAVQGWIPVEEQPPVFPCLVCDANGNQPSVPLGIVTITDEEHGEWHIDGRLWDTKIFFKGEWCSQTGYGNRIIAWMPLPDPYKGGEDK